MHYDSKARQATVKRVAEQVRQAMYEKIAPLEVTAYWTPEPVPYAQRQSGKKLDLKPGDKWGNLFDCAWFHFTGKVPQIARGKDVVLRIDVNGEACVFDERGVPVIGLTTRYCLWESSMGDASKRIVPMAEGATGREIIDIWADAGCNTLFGAMSGDGKLEQAEIAIRHPNLLRLHYDMEVLMDLTEVLPAGSAQKARVLQALYDAANAMSRIDDDHAQAACEILATELARKNGDAPLTLSAIGHAHIDLAWLWPIRETLRKGERTFATALRNMEKYPDYVFGMSQPQLYQWIKDKQPELYQQIKQRVAEGRWDVQGGMWIESDTNVPGGESLVRQFFYGKKFFREEFGKDLDYLWLPDCFGYTGALPQILRQCGIRYFMTQKMSWNSVNRFPHHTFRWQGIDGSEVLAHMVPEATYNSTALPRALHKSEVEFEEKNVSGHALLLFGIGDGGGGPGEEHLEHLARQKNLLGLPPVIQERAEQFFTRIDRDTQRYPLWSGELYLERHRGTYTTQARNKKWNRRMEILLRETEWLAAWAREMLGTPYPFKELEEIWHEVLLQQFHDILPGSSIKRVYDESLASYEAVHAKTLKLRDAAEQAILKRIDTTGMKKPVAVFNSLSYERQQYLKIDERWFKVKVPAMGYCVIDTAVTEPVQHEYGAPEATPCMLFNGVIRVKFNEDGSIGDIDDIGHNCGALAEGKAGNRLAVYADSHDAWDIPPDYRSRPPEYFKLQSSSASVDGPCAIVEQVYTYGRSTLWQKIILRSGRARIDFITRVDWHESQKMLRTSFPLSVRSDHATCEIQFGRIQRPTGMNTSWDAARFEVCAHRWVDISDASYGVALLNDCKYGYHIEPDLLDLNLLRSTNHPGKDADQGMHEFTYSLVTHHGRDPDMVQRSALSLNYPLRAVSVGVHPGDLPGCQSLVDTSIGSILVEAVKRSEKDDGTVLRMYEWDGTSYGGSFQYHRPIRTIAHVDLLERDPRPVTVEGQTIFHKAKPFEIFSFLIQ